jgi:oxygen-independent coproporphyrinogen-3 oxidase
VGDGDEAAERPEPGTPLYVHLPFCAAKCHYCDFFSLPAAGQDVDGTLEAILAEARRRAPAEPRTVYLGGGTPSLLSAEQLTRLLDGLDRLTGFRSSAEEVTAECNPESLDREKAERLVELGVDRLSIGFQALDPELLELFGRVHTVDQSFRAFEAARAAGVRRLSVDLIFAAPGQTLSSWTADLERVLALAPDHLSAYDLAFEERTTFERWLAEGRIQRADEELELELFQATRALLADRGLGAYEVSNFALTGQECRHNLNYWRNGPYAGIGPSAASHLGGRRFGNPRSIGAWRRGVETGRQALAFEERLAPRERLGETWWLGLRLAEGVDPAEARSRAGVTLEEGEDDPALGVADGLVGAGLLERRGTRLRLSPRGLLLADAVAAEFLGLAGEQPVDAARAGRARALS